MAKQIDGTLGDDVGTAAIGEGNRQSVRDASPSSVVNNYIEQQREQQRERNERHRGGGISVDERLERLEEANEGLTDELRNLDRLVYGDPKLYFVGIADQLSKYMNAVTQWQTETEKRIIALEEGNQIVISPQVALGLAVLFIIALIVVYFAVVWLQKGAI